MAGAATIVIGLLVTGSWWGGKSADEATAIARDEAGNLYVAGTTQSDDLRESGGGLSSRSSKASYPGDVYVQKMSTSGSLVWRAIIGGSFTDRALAVAVDRTGAVYVAGVTYSFDFPVTATGFRRTSGNPAALAGDAFLFKLTPEGNRLLYSTYYGGDEGDQANAVAVDDAGQAVIAGESYSDNLPTTPGTLAPGACPGYGYDGFVARFNATGTGLIYGTYLCGSGHDHPRALALNAQGAAYVAGETASRDFPVTKGAFRESLASPNFDAFTVKLAPDGRALEWGTLYGGVETERLAAMAIDSEGRVLIAGETRSSDLPGAAAVPAGMQDGFVARLSADGRTVDWARLFGGIREEHVSGLEVSADRDVWVGGWTRSPDWAGEPAGSDDGFLVSIPGGGVGDLRIARLGGRARDRIAGVRLAGPFVAAIGSTENAEWISGGQPGAGQTDAFVALTETRAVGSRGVEPTESRARRPESGWSLWSGAGRIPYQPLAPVGSGQRWLVELTAAPAAAQSSRWKGLRGIARESELAMSRSAVRTAQTAVRSAVERTGARVYGSADLVSNVLFVEAAPDMAASLSLLPAVKRVLPVGQVAPDLDATLSTHLVLKAFERIGGEINAGAGVKLGIIDTGVDASHPAFADRGLPPLDGFPRANKAADLANTNGKVIVARGYIPVGEAAHSKDDVQHGSGVAAVAAGSRAESTIGPVVGVAPFAYIGNYKMMTSESSQLSGDDALILALEDAAADGMNVVNLSLHTYRLLLRPEDDIYSDICERMVSMGVMVVRSTGNEGPEWSTLTNPHFGEWGILVGSHVNSRTLGTKVDLPDGTWLPAIPANNVEMSTSGEVSGPLAEVQQFAPGTWGCTALPADSLKGKIALIDRGTCNFSVKGENARRAGAVAMIVMALAEAPDPLAMSMASERLPAFMVSHWDGQKLREKVTGGAALAVRIPLVWQRYDGSPDAMAGSSSIGPGMSMLGIKPDLIATGDGVWTAKAAGGWALASGTSFSSPHVAGSVAVLVGQRPGLDPRHYRSLIINTATPVVAADGRIIPVMKQGAGRLNLDAALASTVSAYPTSLHFGWSRGDFNLDKAVRLVNLGAGAASCQVSPEPRDGPVPTVQPDRVEMAAGGEAWVVLNWKGSAWKPGQYEGHLRVRCDGAEYPLSIPYWHGVTAGAVTSIKIAESIPSGKVGQILYYAAQFRLVDEAGLPLDGAKPVVTVKSGSGSVVDVVSRASTYPGIYALHVRPGAGQTVFQIAIGGLSRDVTVTGE